MLGGMQTVLHWLNAQAERLGDRPALWSRRGDLWMSVSWRDYARTIRDLTAGFVAIGLRPRSVVGIVGGNREETIYAFLAVMAAGAYPLGINRKGLRETYDALRDRRDVDFWIAETEDDVKSLGANPCSTDRVIIMDGTSPQGRSFDEVLSLGMKSTDSHYYERLEQLKPHDIAVLALSREGSSSPVPVILTHQNLNFTAERRATCLNVDENDATISFLSLAAIAEQMNAMYGAIYSGTQVYLVPNETWIARSLHQVRPTVFIATPEVWSDIQHRVDEYVSGLTMPEQRMFRWARRIANVHHAHVQSHRQSPVQIQGKLAVARASIFSMLKERLGLNRTHHFYAHSGSISPTVLEYFSSVDIVIAEMYGQTETCGLTSVGTNGALKFGRVGRPISGTEMKIADDGEIYVRGGNVCAGYWNDTARTAARIQNGWFATKDRGTLDEDGLVVLESM